MKILKMKLFQESACYKKPFAFKVAETYPLPPYSTVIGMLHKILQAKSGEYFDMNISIQGDYESIFSNYQNLRMYKGQGEVTSMPRNVHQLLNVRIVIHVQAEDEIIEKLYHNIITGKESFTLGRNEDLVRVDEIKQVKAEKKASFEMNRNAYVPLSLNDENTFGIHYRLNSVYTIDENALRKWQKVDVNYIEADSNTFLRDIYQDEEGDGIFWMK